MATTICEPSPCKGQRHEPIPRPARRQRTRSAAPADARGVAADFGAWRVGEAAFGRAARPAQGRLANRVERAALSRDGNRFATDASDVLGAGFHAAISRADLGGGLVAQAG